MNVNEEMIKRLEELEIENKELRKLANIRPEDKVSVGHSEDHPKFPCSGCKRLYDANVLKNSLCNFCKGQAELEEYADTDKVLKKFGVK